MRLFYDHSETPHELKKMVLVKKNRDSFLRSRFGVFSVRVSTQLSGKTRLELDGQSGLYAPLDRKSHHLLLLLFLWRKTNEDTSENESVFPDAKPQVT